jgi:hypothetical protein
VHCRRALTSCCACLPLFVRVPAGAPRVFVRERPRRERL